MLTEAGEDLADRVGAVFEVSRWESFVWSVHVRFLFDAEACADDGESAQAKGLEQWEGASRAKWEWPFADVVLDYVGSEDQLGRIEWHCGAVVEEVPAQLE